MINYFDPGSSDLDLGTPERASDVQVSLVIDGRTISVPAGTSVMRAAAMLGTSIPKLCATDSLEAFGSCRMCMVEIDGMRGYPACAPRQWARAWWCARKPRAWPTCGAT